jgi:hypothetical protein
MTSASHNDVLLQLHFLPLIMQHGGGNRGNRMLSAWNFIEAAQGRTHFLVLVDTHSDSFNGRIVHTSSPTHGTVSSDMSEVGVGGITL